jgi:hypothetical protein
VANEYLDAVKEMANGKAPSADNPYLDAATEVFSEKKVEIKQSMFAASQIDPAKQARLVGLSDKYKLPLKVVEQSLDKIENHEKINSIDYDTLMSDAPAVAQWLKNPKNAAIGQGEIENLGKIEKAVKILRHGQAPASSLTEDVSRAGQTGWNDLTASAYLLGGAYGYLNTEDAAIGAAESNKKAQELRSKIPDYAREFNDAMEKERGDVDKAVKTLTGSFGKAREGEVLQALKDFAVGGASTVGETLDLINESIVKRPKGTTYSVVENLAQSFPAIIGGYTLGKAGAATGAGLGAGVGAFVPIPGATAAGAGIGATVGGLSGLATGTFLTSAATEIGASVNEELRKRGYDVNDHEAIAHALSDPELMSDVRARAERKGFTTATIEALVSMIGGRMLGKTKGAGALGKLKAHVKEVGLETVGEVAGEASGQIAREQGDLSKVDFGEAAFEGIASLGHSIGQSAVTGAVSTRKVFSKNTVAAAEEVAVATQKAVTAAHDAQALKEVGQAFKDSKTASQLPERLKELVDIASEGGEPANVYLQTDAWDEYWTSKGASPAKAAEQILGDNGKIYYQAKTSGTHMEVPLSQYVSKIAPTEHFDGLLPIVRLKEDGMTLLEAQDHLKSLPATMEELAKESENFETGQSEDAGRVKESISKDIAAQLTATGMVNEKDASDQAAIYGERFVRRAEVLGVDPRKLYESEGLSIVRREQMGEQEPAATVEPELKVAQYKQDVLQAIRDEVAGITTQPGGLTKDSEGYVTGRFGASSTAPEYFQKKGYTKKETVAAIDKQISGKKLTEKQSKIVADLYQSSGYDSEFKALVSEPFLQKDKSVTIRGFFDPSKNLIGLLPDMNRSTFLHETGHAWLEEVKRDLDFISKIQEDKRTDRQNQFLEDSKVILEHLGVKSFDKIETEHHEKWARSVEAYFMEGKAPTLELRKAFARFRAWLISVYRELKSLKVDLSDDIRGVMDRLIAAEDAIETAQMEMKREPLFVDPSAVGMTGKKAEEYAKAREDSRRAAEEKLASQLMSEETKERKGFIKSERKIVEAVVSKDVNSRPIYEAIARMEKGKLPNGEPLPEGVAAFKISKAAIVEAYGDDALGKLPKVYAKEGMHPDAAAELLGFSSGDELIKQMSQAPKRETLIKSLTDSRMAQLYPGMLDDGTLPERAIRAVHNNHTARLLRIELEHLASQNVGAFNEAVRRVVRRVPSDKFIRSQAEQIISSKRFRDIKPDTFRRAEIAASKDAGSALAKKDLDAAFLAKQRELLNHELYRAALDAKEEIESIAKYMKKFVEQPARERLGKAGQEYLEQVDSIMERFDLAKGVTLTDVDKRKSLRAWYENQVKEGYQPVIPEKLLDESFKKHYKDMTLTELTEVRDSVKSIETMAGLKNKLLKAKRLRELDAALDEATASIEANSKGKRPKVFETRLPGEEPMRLSDGFTLSHRKFSSLIRQMDGFKDGGVMWELLVEPMNDAANKESEMREGAAVKLQEIFGAYTKKEIGFATPKLHSAMPSVETGLYKKEFIPEIDGSLSKMGQLMVALNWGNADSRQKVMDGRGWNESQVKAILKRLDKRDWEFVQSVWDFIDSYWVDTKSLAERVSGVAPDKVEAAEVVTQHGTFRGGYFPLKYDDRLEPKAYSHLAEEAAKRAMSGGAVRASTKHGHRESRVEGVKMPVRLDFGVIFEHVTEVIHDQTHYEFLIDTNRLLGNRKLQSSIISHYGDQVYGELRDTVRDVASGDVPAQEAFEKAINHLRVGSSIAAMGWNLMTSLSQPLGLTQSMVRVGPKWIAKGMSKWLGDATRMESTVKDIHEKSSFMRLRHKTQVREINEIRNSLTLRGSTIGALDQSFFYLIGKAQMIADVPTWLGAYEKAYSEMSIDMKPDETEKRAVALADQAVIDAQGGGQTKDLARIQRGGPLKKLWTNFYSFFNTTYNLTAESFAKTDFKSAPDVGRFAVDMLLLYTLPAVLGFALKEAAKGRGGGDDDLAERLAKEQAFYLLNTMVGVRELSAALQGFNGYSGPAGTRFFSEFGSFAKQVEQGEMDEAAIRALNKVSGIFFHYPAGQVDRTVRGFSAILDGDTTNPSALLFGPPPKR